MIATVVLATFVFVSPTTIRAETYLYFSADPKDDYLYITSRVLERRRSEPDGPAVVLLGGSSVGSSLTGPDDLGRRVALRTGFEPTVYDYCAGNLTTWEMAGLLAEFGSDFDGVVLIGLSPYTLADGLDRSVMGREYLSQLVRHPRVGFTSEVFDEEARLAGLEVPRRTGIYAVDNFDFFVSRRSVLIANLRDGMEEFERRPYVGREPFGRPYWRVVEDAFTILEASYRDRVAEHLEIVSRMRERMPRASFAILVPPLHPRQMRNPTTRAFLHSYREDLERFAETWGMALIDVSARAELRDSDFLDPGHLRLPSAQERATEVLADGVASLFREGEAGE